MKKITLHITIDRIKQIKKQSREAFAQVKLGSKKHRDKKQYTRKSKHKNFIN